MVLQDVCKLLGAGLGASGGIARIGASLSSSIAPVHTAASEYFGAWGERPLRYYLVFMPIGLLLLLLPISVSGFGVIVMPLK